MLETVVLLNIFLSLFQDYLMNKKNRIYLKWKCCVTLYSTVQKFGVSHLSFF